MSAEKYYNQIEVLNSTLWEGRALKPKIAEWLDNFDFDQEKDYALYLLSRLMYFSSYNIRTLLRSLYRDLYRYPIIKKIRQDNKDTLDPILIEREFAEQMSRTRFLGVGNPSESGVHLLYYFRQENKISKSLFVNTDDVIKRHTDGAISLRNEFESADRFVFIDDLCGSGEQATTDTNVKRCVDDIKKLNPHAHVSYLMLFGMSDGMQKIRDCGLYDHVEAVIELDNSYRCFSDCSRYFMDGTFDKSLARKIVHKHGYKLMKNFFDKMTAFTEAEKIVSADCHALGFGDCQLMISLHHNTPDNTLPIFWYDEDESLWTPIFKRYNKVY